MSGSALGAIQTAVYAALTGDRALMALVRSVRDEITEDAPFPYVTIGDATELPFDSFAEYGSDATLTLHVWSRGKGFKEAQAITHRLIQLLDNNTGLAVAGLTTVLLNKEMTETLREQDGITRHVIVRFRIITDGL